MVRRFRMFLAILVAMVFMGSAATPAAAQADAGRGAGGEYPQKVARVTAIACVSLEITRKHVVAVNTAVKVDADAETFLPRFNSAITRLPAVIAASPSIMRAVFGILLTQFTAQRDQLVADGKSPALYASIVNTSDSMLTLFPHVQCTL